MKNLRAILEDEGLYKAPLPKTGSHPILQDIQAMFGKRPFRITPSQRLPGMGASHTLYPADMGLLPAVKAGRSMSVNSRTFSKLTGQGFIKIVDRSDIGWAAKHTYALSD